jgi:hypothetical protein
MSELSPAARENYERSLVDRTARRIFLSEATSLRVCLKSDKFVRQLRNRGRQAG